MHKLLLSSPGQKDIAINIPSTWNELSTPEMELVATHLTRQDATDGEIKAAILVGIVERRALAGKISLQKNWASFLDAEDAATQGFDAIAFIFGHNDRTINPHPTLKVPGITGGNSIFHGPADDYNDFTAGELEDAEVLMDQPAKLAQIIALFWRLPISKDELMTRQQRFPYESQRAEHYASSFAQLPMHTLMSCFMFLVGCRAMLPKYFPGPYGKPVAGEGKADPAAFTKCIHAGAGVKNGTRDNIRRMLAKEFLFDLQQECDSAKAQEKEIQKISKKQKLL